MAVERISNEQTTKGNPMNQEGVNFLKMHAFFVQCQEGDTADRLTN